ncbi:MAG: hypothetical protein HRT88_17625 [Lentisphaeraceae bacterium]|nr:hypothetical protein [Lentisphaeraceae bacterium]
MGLWTQGKMVLMDNLLNGSDYGIEARRAQHRLVDLYNDNIAVRVGSMRTNSLKELPTFSLGNLTFFDSIENMMNYNDNMRPNKPNDVVWWISDGKSTDQFSFDDYLYLASNSARDRKFHIEVNGTSVSGQVTYNTAGAGKQSWQNVTIPNIELPKGFKRCASFLIEQDKTSIPSKLAPQVNHKNPRH